MGVFRFQLRADKINSKGRAPIRVIYQESDQREYFPTDQTCPPHNWHPKEQTAIYLDKKAAKALPKDVNSDVLLMQSEVLEINRKLNAIREVYESIIARFKLDRVQYSPKMVIEALRATYKPETKTDTQQSSVIDFIKLFAKDSTSTHKLLTLKTYLGLAEHLTAFQKFSGKKATFDKMDIPFMRSFHAFLTENREWGRGEVKSKGVNNITAAKQMSLLKTLLKYARSHYKIEVNPDYIDYKIARKDSDFEVITLTNDEFLALYNLDLSDNERLERTRDVFCFSCATGLRYSDLAQLKREHIRNDAIKMTAAKTGQRLEIPLNPFSASILAKYKGQHQPLPIISNQKTNDNIKDLCKLAGIDTPIEIIREYGVRKVSEIFPKYELISIHTGRKTFTTLSLEKGIAAQEVMAITGHSTYKAFKRYVDITSKRKQAVMAQAWGAVPNPLKKAE